MQRRPEAHLELAAHCGWVTGQQEVIPVLGYCEYAGSLGLNPLAGRLDHSGDAVTKMSRKSWKTTAILRKMATKEGESGLREFAPTC